MPDSCVHVYVHLVWATYRREPLITAEYEPAIYGCIAEKCRKFGCLPLAVGGTSDHIHVFVRLSTTVSIGRLVKNMKGASSHLVSHALAAPHGFKWQVSYGGFGVEEHHILQVVRYVEHQKEHHATGKLWPDLENIPEETDPISEDDGSYSPGTS